MSGNGAVITLWLITLAALLVLSTVASYLRLLMRRLTPLGAQKLFQSKPGSRIQSDRERVGVSISAVHGAIMALFSVGVIGLFILERPNHLWENLGASLLVVISAVAICDQLIPFILVARHDEPERLLARWMPFLRLTVFLALPLTFPILVSTTIARLLEPLEVERKPASTQEDLHELIEVGKQQGLIEREQGELLQSVVDFNNKVVRELMTPRPEIAAIEVNAPVEELRRLFRVTRSMRYPVYEKELDRVEGIVNVRDLIVLPPAEQAGATIRSLVRPAVFTPETKPAAKLLKELQQSTTQMAIVIDEYGSVSGLITIEDLVESIVGEIQDEVEPHAYDIVRESADSYIVAGQTELSHLTSQFHTTFRADDYSTVAGLVVAHLGYVPTPGEKVEKNGLTFEVLEANQRTVLKVRLHLPPVSSSAATRAEPHSL